MQSADNRQIDRVPTYRTFCAELDAMSITLAEMGEFIVAAHVQAALDALRQELIAAEGSR